MFTKKKQKISNLSLPIQKSLSTLFLTPTIPLQMLWKNGNSTTFCFILNYFSDSSLEHKEVELLQLYRFLPNQEKQLLPEQGKLLMRIRRSRKNNPLSPEEGAVLCGSAVTRSCNFSHENIYFFVQKCFRRILFKILTFFFNLSIVNPKSHPI